MPEPCQMPGSVSTGRAERERRSCVAVFEPLFLPTPQHLVTSATSKVAVLEAAPLLWGPTATWTLTAAQPGRGVTGVYLTSPSSFPPRVYYPCPRHFLYDGNWNRWCA